MPRLTLRRPGPRWISLRTWRLWRKPKRGGSVPGNGLNASARYRADSLESPTYSSLPALCDQSVFPWSLHHPTSSQPCTSSSSSRHLYQLKNSWSESIFKECRRVCKAEIVNKDYPCPHLYYFQLHYHLVVFLKGKRSVKGLIYGNTCVEMAWKPSTVLDWGSEAPKCVLW